MNDYTRILFINNSCRVSGAEMSLLDLLAGLDPGKCKVVVVIPGRGELYDRLAGKHPIEILPLTRFTRGKSFMTTLFFVWQWIGVSFRLARYVRRENIDLIYANNVQSQLYGVLAGLLSFRKNIWHVRDNPPGYAITKLFSLFSSRVICVSDFIYKRIPANSMRKFRVYNGLDTESWDPEKLGRDQHFEGYPFSGKTVVGLVGQLIPWKGHMDLVLAAEQVIRRYEDVQFFFIGEEPGGARSSYPAELKRMIARKGLANYFTFCGFQRNIKECINGLDILVNCSANEPFGRVVIEAMALEKAVITYRQGGPAEIVDHLQTGLLVDAHDVDMLAGNLVFLLQNKVIRTQLGRAARQSVVRRFSLAQTTHRIQEIILS